MNVNLENLIGRLNSSMLSAFEGSAGLCLSKRHYEVEIEHLFLKLLEEKDNDLIRMLRFSEVNAEQFQRDLTASLDRLKTGNSGVPVPTTFPSVPFTTKLMG